MIKLNEENVLLQILIPRTKYDIQTDSTAALYSEGLKLNSKYEDWLSKLRIVVAFLSPTRKMLGLYFKLCQDCSLSLPIQYSLSS
jgi:hypothetical protein